MKRMGAIDFLQLKIVKSCKILLIILSLPQISIASVSTVAVTTGRTNEHPTWLTPVSKNVLQKYLEIARERHNAFVKKALENFKTDHPLEVLSGRELAAEQALVDSLKFKEFCIESSNKLPDFHDELGDRKVFVTAPETPILSHEECKEIIELAEAAFAGKPFPTLPSGPYHIGGFWIKDVPEVREWYVRKVKTRLFPILRRQFPHFVDSVADLVVDNSYFFKYTPIPGRRTDIHTDQGCLSFTIALNSKHEYEGGGTWVEGLKSLDGKEENKGMIEMDTGHVTVRPAGIRHCGMPVTEGTRYIIGGFCMNSKRVEYVRMLMENDDACETSIREGLECIITINPGFDGAYSHLANSYKKMGQTEKAQKVLEHCLLKVNPCSGETAYCLGVMYYEQKKYKDAIDCMTICLAADSADGEAMNIMAQSMAKTGNVAEEDKWYQRILSTPGLCKKVHALAYCNMGILREGSDDEISYYQKSLEILPDYQPAIQSLGSAYASRKEWDEAAKAYRMVLESFEGKKEDRLDTLRLLYKVAIQKIRQGGGNMSSREQMVQQLNELMGFENYELLTSSIARKG
mmetsp:Transcript_7734/g.8835  ORF Transcript_7734/g.8835 Transcript_7734/m.8835 type:complete len:574 (-) Transcript_7734:394-2115(-)